MMGNLTALNIEHESVYRPWRTNPGQFVKSPYCHELNDRLVIKKGSSKVNFKNAAILQEKEKHISWDLLLWFLCEEL